MVDSVGFLIGACLGVAAIVVAVTVPFLVRISRKKDTVIAEVERLQKENWQLRQLSDAINDSNVMLIFDRDENLKSVSAAFCSHY